MPKINVVRVLRHSLLANEPFIVRRRTDVQDNFGEEQITYVEHRASGCVYPDGDNSLDRQADMQFMYKTIKVVTEFRIQGPSPGQQADTVIWKGDEFLVRNIEDFSSYGQGFVVAQCSSMDRVDQPPQ